ncbi:uncharacterized protein LOC108118367 [Drosophila eugracilis]|uniref:uncharacterized protein LOC108118367 n=1 Tax=Drosophila eugracilis TaxID=29029 RepID=UPI0007E5E22D|nr:uncharacterized protein LOC108118367 [Drosophila eugracilis]
MECNLKKVKELVEISKKEMKALVRLDKVLRQIKGGHDSSESLETKVLLPISEMMDDLITLLLQLAALQPKCDAGDEASRFELTRGLDSVVVNLHSVKERLDCWREEQNIEMNTMIAGINDSTVFEISNAAPTAHGVNPDGDAEPVDENAKDGNENGKEDAKMNAAEDAYEKAEKEDNEKAVLADGNAEEDVKEDAIEDAIDEPMTTSY